MTIGERIKQRREQLGMTQEELAEKLGYKSKTSINKIEMGKQDLTQRKIPAAADALKTSIAYIMGWEEDAPPVPPATPQDDDGELMFALWGESELMDADDLAAVRSYAAFLKERKERAKKE